MGIIFTTNLYNFGEKDILALKMDVGYNINDIHYQTLSSNFSFKIFLLLHRFNQTFIPPYKLSAPLRAKKIQLATKELLVKCQKLTHRLDKNFRGVYMNGGLDWDILAQDIRDPYLCEIVFNILQGSPEDIEDWNAYLERLIRKYRYEMAYTLSIEKILDIEDTELITDLEQLLSKIADKINTYNHKGRIFLAYDYIMLVVLYVYINQKLKNNEV